MKEMEKSCIRRSHETHVTLTCGYGTHMSVRHESHETSVGNTFSKETNI